MMKLHECCGVYFMFAVGSAAFHREVWNRISELFSWGKKHLPASSTGNLVVPSSLENSVPHSAFTACSGMHKNETANSHKNLILSNGYCNTGRNEGNLTK